MFEVVVFLCSAFVVYVLYKFATGDWLIKSLHSDVFPAPPELTPRPRLTGPPGEVPPPAETTHAFMPQQSRRSSLRN